MKTNTSVKLITGAMLCLVSVMLIIVTHMASAGTALIRAPDGSRSCSLVTAKFDAGGNADIYVDGCLLGDGDTPPEQPPTLPPSTGDPGAGVWNPNPGLTVFDLSPTSNRTFVPGCIAGQDWRSGCPYSGSLQHGHSYAARINVDPGQARRYTIARAEAGETSASVSGAVSTIPGELTNATKNCQLNLYSQAITVSDSQTYQASIVTLPNGTKFEPAFCILPDGPGYLSFTPTDQLCGKGGKTCRVQILD